MRIIETEEDRIEVFDADVWLQEKQIIRFKHKTQQTQPAVTVTLYRGTIQVSELKVATYTLDINGEVVIDAKDIIRTFPNAGGFVLGCEQDDPISFTFAVVGLINPESVIIPHTDAAKRLADAFGWGGNVVVPPSRMLTNINENALIRAEFYPGAEKVGAPRSYMIDESAEGDDRVIGRVVTFADGQTQFRTFDDDTARDIQKGTIAPLQCGHRYAAVRWVSFTGVTRVHTFEAVEQKSAFQGDFVLEMADCTSQRIKGRRDEIGLKIDGLDAYGMWYYSDICYSSRVEVSFDGVNWVLVDVLTKGVQVPDGNSGEFNEMVVNVKYREYDAFTM